MNQIHERFGNLSLISYSCLNIIVMYSFYVFAMHKTMGTNVIYKVYKLELSFPFESDRYS